MSRVAIDLLSEQEKESERREKLREKVGCTWSAHFLPGCIAFNPIKLMFMCEIELFACILCFCSDFISKCSVSCEERCIHHGQFLFLGNRQIKEFRNLLLQIIYHILSLAINGIEIWYLRDAGVFDIHEADVE